MPESRWNVQSIKSMNNKTVDVKLLLTADVLTLDAELIIQYQTCKDDHSENHVEYY